jgi:phosphonate transport system substrate-binding protein
MKTILSPFLCSLCMLWSGAAQAQADAPPLVLTISEGSSGTLDHAQYVAKYQGLGDAVSRALKAKISLVFTRDFELLEENMRAGRTDLVMFRASDFTARAMRDYGYSYISTAKPDGQCFIVVPKDSPLKTLADIKGKRIAMSEKSTYMSRFCTAELKSKGIALEKENVQFLREQNAIGLYLDSKLADVGAIASYSKLGAQWEKSGNRVLHKSVAQPYFPLVASKKIRPEQLKAIQAELLALSSSDPGREALKRMGIESFDTGSEARLRELLKWLNPQP